MRRIFSWSLVLSLCLLLFLPAVADTDTKPDQKLPPDFIALSESPMSWSDAKAFCRQQGGRLPRINDSDSWDGRGGTTIDGFGAGGAPWSSGLPGDYYWTGTEFTGNPGNSWLVNDYGGNVGVRYGRQSDLVRVVCVPLGFL